MDPELKEQWLDALKSGRYAKGRQALRSISNVETVERFCCLGVLCDILDPEGWQEPTDASFAASFANKTLVPYAVRGGSVNVAYLPEEYVEKADIHNQMTLTRINDKSETFEPVIEFIEQHM